MVRGRVLRFDEVRGYGFIGQDRGDGDEDSGGEDIFMHVADLLTDKRLIRPGVAVEFELSQSDRGWKASEIRPIPSSPPRRHPTDFMGAVTDAIIATIPTATAEQIATLRELLMEITQRSLLGCGAGDPLISRAGEI
jgi:CspA family cold shock protein